VSPPADAIALSLARLRHTAWLLASDLPLAQAEERASQAGRQIVLVDGENGTPALAVLSWQGTDPVESTRPPRLPRRTLSRNATKTLVVAHALLSDPEVSRASVTQSQVLAVIQLLSSRSGESWAIPSLRAELPQAGFLTPCREGWAPGPVMSAWDRPTREVMAQAAQQLREHPAWPETRHG
jgi:hypothetical protein